MKVLYNNIMNILRKTYVSIGLFLILALNVYATKIETDSITWNGATNRVTTRFIIATNGAPTTNAATGTVMWSNNTGTVSSSPIFNTITTTSSTGTNSFAGTTSISNLIFSGTISGNGSGLTNEHVYFTAYRTNVTLNTPNTSWVSYTNNYVTNDSHNGYSTSTGKYTIPRTAYYIFRFTVSLSGGSSTAVRGDLYINGGGSGFIVYGSHNTAYSDGFSYTSPILYLTNGTTVIPAVYTPDGQIFAWGSYYSMDYFSGQSVN